MTITWKNIPSTNGIYSASVEGEIRSNECARLDGRLCKSKTLKYWINNNGYAMVSLRLNGKTIRYTVHELVALTFIGERPSGCDINHIDGDKLNNSVNNLEYVTRSENLRKYYQSDLYDEDRRMALSIRMRNKSSKWKQSNYKPVSQYDIDMNHLQDYESVSAASKFINGDRTAISRCCNGKQKTSYGFVWKWTEQGVTTSSTERRIIGESPNPKDQIVLTENK